MIFVWAEELVCFAFLVVDSFGFYYFLVISSFFVYYERDKKLTGSDHSKTLEITVQNTTLKNFPSLKFSDKCFCFVF